MTRPPAATPSRWSGRPLSRHGAKLRDSSVPATDRSRKKPRKSGSLSALSPSALTNRGQAADGLESSRWNRAALETGALVLALLLVAGIIVYFSWPYSQDELYRKAEALMASSKRSDWKEARDEYLDKLDQRFPNHPFREQIQKWRDKIALEDAERRAPYLNGPVPTDLANSAERSFKITNALAVEASGRGDDLAALDQWQKLAGLLKTDDPNDRGWHLLALRRATALDRCDQGPASDCAQAPGGRRDRISQRAAQQGAHDQE